MPAHDEMRRLQQPFGSIGIASLANRSTLTLPREEPGFLMLKGLSQATNTALDRLIDALVDPRRRERAVLLLLAAYCAVWSLYGAISKASQDIHYDMGEAV